MTQMNLKFCIPRKPEELEEPSESLVRVSVAKAWDAIETNEANNICEG